MMMFITISCHIGERLKLEGETENMGVCTEERKGGTAEVLMATPCTNSSNFIHWVVEVGGKRMRMCGAQALLEVCRRFLVGSGRPSMLMLVRSAAALATMSLMVFGSMT